MVTFCYLLYFWFLVFWTVTTLGIVLIPNRRCTISLSYLWFIFLGISEIRIWFFTLHIWSVHSVLLFLIYCISKLIEKHQGLMLERWVCLGSAYYPLAQCFVYTWMWDLWRHIGNGLSVDFDAVINFYDKSNKYEEKINE